MSTNNLIPTGIRLLSLYVELPAMDFIKKIGSTIITILILSGLTQAQSYNDDFWANPNIIWKTNTGTIITAAFAKKMHTQGNYQIMERELYGGRKEIKMVPPETEIKKAPIKINWSDPNLVVKDDAGEIIPKERALMLSRIKSIDKKTSTLSDGSTQVIFNIGASEKWKSAWAESNIQYIKEWTAKWKGQRLPNFKFKSLEDEVVSNSTLKGKIKVLSFWNSSCNKCAREIPQLNKSFEALYDTEAVFLAPTYELSGTARMFKEEKNFNYTILSNAQSLIDDLGIEYYPTHMIVDGDGIILDINVGGYYNIGEDIGIRLSELLTK